MSISSQLYALNKFRSRLIANPDMATAPRLRRVIATYERLYESQVSIDSFSNVKMTPQRIDYDKYGRITYVRPS